MRAATRGQDPVREAPVSHEEKKPELVIEGQSHDLTAERFQRQTDFLLVGQDSLAPPLSVLRPRGGRNNTLHLRHGRTEGQPGRQRPTFTSIESLVS